MSTTTQFLRQFKKGNFMCCNVCTQCYNTGTVTVKDDRKTYFVAKKTTTSTALQHLLSAGADYEGGNNLRVEFQVDTHAALDVAAFSNAILDKKGEVVGHVYSFCLEDSFDADYNDFYVNIVAWDKKG